MYLSINNYLTSSLAASFHHLFSFRLMAVLGWKAIFLSSWTKAIQWSEQQEVTEREILLALFPHTRRLIFMQLRLQGISLKIKASLLPIFSNSCGTKYPEVERSCCTKLLYSSQCAFFAGSSCPYTLFFLSLFFNIFSS